MTVADLSDYRAAKDLAAITELPTEVLPWVADIDGPICVDSETSGLYCDEGATVAAVSVAYRLKGDPGYIYHHAFAFDQGRAEDKGFTTLHYPDTPTYRKRGHVDRPKGDPDLLWDWDTDYNLGAEQWNCLMRWLQEAAEAHGVFGANLKFDLHQILNGTRHFDGVELEKWACWDTQLVSAELWPGELTGLKPTAIRLWGSDEADEADLVKRALIEVKKRYGLTAEHGPRYDLMPWEVNGPYASQDAVLTYRLREYQIQMLEDGQGSWQHVRQAIRLMRVLYRMEKRGFGPLDIEKARSEAERIHARVAELEPTFPFQPPTAAHASEYFFDHLGLTPWNVGGGEEPRTKEIVPDRRKGQPAGATRLKITKQGTLTASVARRMGAAGVEHASEYGEYVELKILNQMFYQNYADLAGPDRMVRTDFKQAFVKSGRMALPVADRVLTPRGWVCMGNIGVGSEVVGSDGAPTTVVAVPYRGQAQIYRVRISDGTEIRCSDNHLWSYRKHGRRDRRLIRTATTQSIKAQIEHGAALHLPDLQPIQTAHQHVPVDPYVLGVLLGNGHLTRSPRFSVFEADTDIAERVAKRTPDEVRRHADRTDRSVRYGLIGGDTERNLAGLGLLGTVAATKFVPAQYLIGSVEQRYDLLRGLMDTDGYIDTRHGNARYDTASEALAFAVRDLVLSLGGVASIRERKALNQHNGPGPYYIVHISSREAPVSSVRKLAHWRRPIRFPRRIVGVDVLDEQTEMQCITVDAPDHLFVTDGYVLTHNSVQRAQLQAIPKKVDAKIGDEPLIEPRKLFLIDEGRTRLGLDLNQAELRIAVQMADCDTMRRLLATGADLHGDTTRRTFGIEKNHPDWDEMRDAAKRLNFAAIFLVGPKTFRHTLWKDTETDWSYQRCADAVYSWRSVYPEFEAAYNYWMRFAERNRYVLLIDHQPSWFLRPNDWPNSAWSRVVQSSLGLFVRDWLIKIEVMTARYGALRLTVHDSVLLDLPDAVHDKVRDDIIEMTEEMWFDWFSIPGGCSVSPFVKGG